MSPILNALLDRPSPHQLSFHTLHNISSPPCKKPQTGITSRKIIYVGAATSNLRVCAARFYDITADGSTTLGAGTVNSSGVATYTTSALAVGAHSITAGYGGDSNDTASQSSAVSVTVNAPPADFTIGLSSTGGTVSSSQTPVGSYTINVSATAGSLSHSATYTLTVQ